MLLHGLRQACRVELASFIPVPTHGSISLQRSECPALQPPLLLPCYLSLFRPDNDCPQTVHSSPLVHGCLVLSCRSSLRRQLLSLALRSTPRWSQSSAVGRLNLHSAVSRDVLRGLGGIHQRSPVIVVSSRAGNAESREGRCGIHRTGGASWCCRDGTSVGAGTTATGSIVTSNIDTVLKSCRIRILCIVYTCKGKLVHCLRAQVFPVSYVPVSRL